MQYLLSFAYMSGYRSWFYINVDIGFELVRCGVGIQSYIVQARETSHLLEENVFHITNQDETQKIPNALNLQQS